MFASLKCSLFYSRWDDYHLLSRKQQVILVRLRTGHNRLNSQSYAPQTEAGTLTNLPLWSRRTNYRASSTKMPPSQSYKRRRVARQHFPDDQTLRLQTGAGEDAVTHLPSGLDRVDCECQEEEEESFSVWNSLPFFIQSDGVWTLNNLL